MEDLEKLEEDYFDKIAELYSDFDQNGLTIQISKDQIEIDQNKKCRTVRRVRRNPQTGQLETIYITICN